MFPVILTVLLSISDGLTRIGSTIEEPYSRAHFHTTTSLSFFYVFFFFSTPAILRQSFPSSCFKVTASVLASRTENWTLSFLPSSRIWGSVSFSRQDG